MTKATRVGLASGTVKNDTKCCCWFSSVLYSFWLLTRQEKTRVLIGESKFVKDTKVAGMKDTKVAGIKDKFTLDKIGN